MTDAHDYWRQADELAAAILVQMEYYAELGVESLAIDIPDASPAPEKSAAIKSRAATKASPPPALSSGSLNSKAAPNWVEIQSLEAFKSISCDMCSIAQKPQWGRGGESPSIVFAGPDPCIYEGEAGDLLYKMIETGLKLKPHQYYIATITKCPLEHGADPALCLGAIIRELELLQPKVVVALGEDAARFLSGRTSDPLGLLRLHTHKVQGLDHIWLRATYSLEDAVASQDVKRELWRDVQKVEKALDRL